MNESMKVTAENDTKSERKVVSIVKNLYKKYDIPLFTNTIIVGEKNIPHSHPVLTLNTRTKDPLDILQTLVHEQFHWYARKHPRYGETIEYLQKYYEDNGEFNTQKYPNSFWEHIIVCWNTRNILQNLLIKEDLKHAYSTGPQYTKTEQFIKDNFKLIQKRLEKFDMVYKEIYGSHENKYKWV